MKLQHTPGPWVFSGIFIEADGEALAQTVGLAYPGDGVLMASAPDLLAALIASHRHPERQHEAGEMPNDCSACAAIEKATRT